MTMKHLYHRLGDGAYALGIKLFAKTLKKIRKNGVHNYPKSRQALLEVGVFPVADHYYEPQFAFSKEEIEKFNDRNLPGIDWNMEQQMELLGKFVFANEINFLMEPSGNRLDFCINNSGFGPGDAETWFQMIRLKKPSRIIEIGSGNSTLVAIQALKINASEPGGIYCDHICIEPFEFEWLKETGVRFIKEKVENLEVDLFRTLNENDILFIDSSHVVRPKGDVLHEILEILPILRKGVIVHFHDIFSPNNYPRHWLLDEVKFWNEQYMLEAFLSSNSDWEVLFANNLMFHRFFNDFCGVSPYISKPTKEKRSNHEPGSFYIQKSK